MKKGITRVLVSVYLLYAVPLILLMGASIVTQEGEQFIISWTQYELAFSDMRFVESLKNATIITLFALVIHVPESILVGVLLARGRFRGKRILYGLFLLALLLPFQVIMMPIYKMSHSVGMFDSHFSVIVLAAFSPMGPLIMSVLIKGVSEEQWEAARIETSSFWKVMHGVILPQLTDGIILLVILTFADVWNMVEQPLILLSTTSKQPISLAFNDFMQVNTEYLWAGSVIYALPIMIIYILLNGMVKVHNKNMMKVPE